MQASVMYTLAKLRMAELEREAAQERLARRAREARRTGAVDAVGYRERLARVLGVFPPLGTRGPRPAGA